MNATKITAFKAVFFKYNEPFAFIGREVSAFVAHHFPPLPHDQVDGPRGLSLLSLPSSKFSHIDSHTWLSKLLVYIAP